MSSTQKLVRFILPSSWFDQVRNSSESWMIQCTQCDSEKSVWASGGIRFGAASVGKRITAQCSTCGRLVAARMYYHESDTSASTQSTAS